MTALGDFVASKREEKGWTQRDLAVKAGVSQNTIHKIESGKTDSPGIDVMQSIAKVFGMSLIDLVGIYLGKAASADLPASSGRSEAFKHVFNSFPEEIKMEVLLDYARTIAKGRGIDASVVKGLDAARLNLIAQTIEEARNE